MTKEHAIREYRKYSGADRYIVGFLDAHNLYIADVAKLMPRWLEMKAPSAHHDEKLQVNLKAKHKKELIKKGAIKLMTEEEFMALKSKECYNRGWMLEKAVYENYLGREWKGTDNERFSSCGDVNIDGLEYQIKFQNAQVVTVTTIHNLQKKN